MAGFLTPEATVKVPLFGNTYTNVDGIELNDDSYELIDGYVNESGSVVRRPGLDLFIDLGQGDKPVDGIWWWKNKGFAVATCNGKVFKITYSGSVPGMTEITGATLANKTRTVFAEGWDAAFNQTLVLADGGGKMLSTDGATAAEIAGSAPATVTHVCSIDGYILANKVNTNQVYYSNLNAPATFGGSYFSAAGNADHVTCLSVSQREIYIGGVSSTEIWEDDGTTPFSRTPGGFLENGVGAPYSQVKFEQSVYWLSDSRRFVRWLNGKLERLPTSYDKLIDSFSSVADCAGFYVEIKGQPFIVWTFPTESKTFAYNINLKQWAEWSRWNSMEAVYERFLGNCYCYSSTWGLHLMGGRTGSLVYSLSSDAYTDNAGPIRLQRISGHIDYGTTKLKRSNHFRIRCKRGQTVTVNPKLCVRWNDDNRGWSNEHWIDLGATGETEIVAQMYRTGIYRTRQYEITASDGVEIIFADAEEDIEVLRS